MEEAEGTEAAAQEEEIAEAAKQVVEKKWQRNKGAKSYNIRAFHKGEVLFVRQYNLSLVVQD